MNLLFRELDVQAWFKKKRKKKKKNVRPLCPDLTYLDIIK